MNDQKFIKVEVDNPLDFYGVNDVNIQLIEKAFQELKIIVRGEEIKAVGDIDKLNELDVIIGHMKDYYDKHNTVKRDFVVSLLNSTPEENEQQMEVENSNEIILTGRSGKLIKARTINQKKMVDSIKKNDIIFAIGPAGTGKTYTAVALAVKALRNKEVRRIVLTRPAVEAGENLGFLPGDLRDKLDPYLQPLYDALRDMIPQEKLLKYFEDGTIEIAPLAFMRGRTLGNAFVILDEAQNTSANQLKMFLTRMGKEAKFIVTGDITQIDLPKNQSSGLVQANKILGNIKGIDFIFLGEKDIVRHKLVTNIIKAYSI